MDALPPPELTELHAACILQASAAYGMDPMAVTHELKVRGGQSAKVFRNPDGTFEVGLMRIPSSALTALAPYGITAQRLEREDCLNIQVATYMMRLRPPQTTPPPMPAAGGGLRQLPLTPTAAAPLAALPSQQDWAGKRQACMARSAEAYQLPLELLQAIAKTEGGQSGTVSRNSNGSVDMGLMQVNSIHLNGAPHRFEQRGITAQQLIYDDCINIAAAASILRHEIDKAPDFWTGVARYHSRTPRFASAYLTKVVGHLRKGQSPMAGGAR